MTRRCGSWSNEARASSVLGSGCPDRAIFRAFSSSKWDIRAGLRPAGLEGGVRFGTLSIADNYTGDMECEFRGEHIWAIGLIAMNDPVHSTSIQARQPRGSVRGRLI